MATSSTEARNFEWWHRVRQLQEAQRIPWPTALVPSRPSREDTERVDESSLEVEYL